MDRNGRSRRRVGAHVRASSSRRVFAKSDAGTSAVGRGRCGDLRHDGQVRGRGVRRRSHRRPVANAAAAVAVPVCEAAGGQRVARSRAREGERPQARARVRGRGARRRASRREQAQQGPLSGRARRAREGAARLVHESGVHERRRQTRRAHREACGRAREPRQRGGRRGEPTQRHCHHAGKSRVLTA